MSIDKSRHYLSPLYLALGFFYACLWTEVQTWINLLLFGIHKTPLKNFLTSPSI
ncbi:hypothetical protein ACQ1P2_08755 [Ornithobacterium rhinotracheale]|uniref:hypothetical protein n=1 Tax=Ornithobacterium rhinotracheale TaxID=28251 RepID=UPI004036063B